jgi:hypothetical protein
LHRNCTAPWSGVGVGFDRLKLGESLSLDHEYAQQAPERFQPVDPGNTVARDRFEERLERRERHLREGEPLERVVPSPEPTVSYHGRAASDDRWWGRLDVR